ncbi:MAG: molybdopterin-binding protein [Planctomycetota bacterium]
MNQKTAIIFCMGRELLEGQVLDRNAHFMAGHVTEIGFRVQSIQVLDEVQSEVVTAFRAALAHEPDYVLVTGGMGPGLDDITRQCVADALGVPMVIDEKAREYLSNSYRRLVAKGVVEDADLSIERLKMATVPQGSTCFENLSGTAPAVRIESGKTVIFLLPGQPEELRRLFTQYVQPHLEADGPGGYRESSTIEYPSGDESLITRLLADLHRRHPEIHGRARMQGLDSDLMIRITLFTEGPDRDELHARLEQATADLRARLGLEVSRQNPDAGAAN